MRALETRRSLAYSSGETPDRCHGFLVCEPVPEWPKRPRLLDQVRHAIRTRHYSPSTEKAYVRWIRRFILFHGKRHPLEMGEAEVTRFLSRLATHGRVSASTQNQALSALLFLYREVLQSDLDWLAGIVKAKRPVRVPVVLTREEVNAVLGQLHGTVWTDRSSHHASTEG